MKKIFYFIWLVWVVIKNIILSNIKLAFHLLFVPRIFLPDIMEIQVGNLGQYQTFVLFNLISMTPGTLSVNYDKEKAIILVHTLYGRNKYGLLQDINQLQKLIEKAF